MSIEPVHIEADQMDSEEAAQERVIERRRQRVAEDAQRSDINLGSPWSWLVGAIVVLLTIAVSSPAPF